MSGLASLVAGYTPPGVYRWVSALTSEELAGSVAAADWHLCEAVTWGAADKHQLLDTLASALSFPEHFGRNLDALVDCLRDVGQENDVLLLWDGWGPVAQSDPETFADVVQILRERASVTTPHRFAVLLRGAEPEIDVPLLD